jgi:hypothetical protein
MQDMVERPPGSLGIHREGVFHGVPGLFLGFWMLTPERISCQIIIPSLLAIRPAVFLDNPQHPRS